MEEIFVLLKEDILQALQEFTVIMEDNRLKSAGCMETLNRTKGYLEESYAHIEDLIDLISQGKIDTYKLLGIISSLKEIEFVDSHKQLSSKLNATQLFIKTFQNQVN